MREDCKHPGMEMPPFDEKACEGKDAIWVRENYPRSNYYCPACKSSVIVYASFKHYVAGDY